MNTLRRWFRFRGPYWYIEVFAAARAKLRTTQEPTT